jgi:adenylate kinase family enzyme
MIVGAPGAGKSTLARALGARRGLPVRHVDLIHWRPGWVERPKAEKIPLVRAIEESDAWVLEGGLSATWERRAARAHLIVWLDLPVALRLWRVVVTRRLQYARGQDRPDLPPGCPERLDPEFLGYILATRRRNRARMRALAGGAGAGRTVRLATPGAVAAFLRAVPPAG